MPVLTVGDVHLAFADQGDGEPPLLLVHGYTGSSRDWAEVMPGLAADRRVVAYDQRGHGASTNLGRVDGYRFDALVEDLGAVVDSMGAGRVHLLGHSMGGVVAMRYALDNRDRLASLVLMDTAAEPTGAMPMDVVNFLVAMGRTQGMAAVADAVLAYVDAEDAARRQRTVHNVTSMDVEALAAFGAELGNYPSLLGRLGELDVPVTVIVGADDPLLEACRTLAATVPGADLAVIERAGHSPQEEQPERWLAVVREHLSRPLRS